MPSEVKAVIDLGSNSVRLVICEQGPHGTQKEIENVKQMVRLSSHLDTNNCITEEGIDVTVRVLEQFKHLCDVYSVTEIVGVATQAVRMANNQEELLQRIVAATGIQFRVLSGHEEAQYGYLAVVNSLAVDEGVTIDVGGGSTEITWFRDRRLVHSASIPYGAVSLTRKFVGSDPSSAKYRRTLERFIRKQLDEYDWLNGLHCPVIGLGGTARAVARMHQRRHQYPVSLLHGYPMWSTEVTAIVDMVSSVPLEKREEISGLPADRADIIVAGATLIDQLVKRVEGTCFMMSNQGLRDGILIEKVLQTRNQELLPDVLMHSIENVQDHFQLNRPHAMHVWALSRQLLAELIRHQWLEEAEADNTYKWLQVAALLHDIGRSISIYNISANNFYLLLQVPLFGISHRDRLLSAAIASFRTVKQTSRDLADYQELLGDDDITTVAQLGVLLGLVHTLDRVETHAVTTLRLQRSRKKWTLLIHAHQPLELQLTLATEWQKKWRKVFQRELRLEVDTSDIQTRDV